MGKMLSALMLCTCFAFLFYYFAEQLSNFAADLSGSMPLSSVIKPNAVTNLVGKAVKAYAEKKMGGGAGSGGAAGAGKGVGVGGGGASRQGVSVSSSSGETSGVKVSSSGISSGISSGVSSAGPSPTTKPSSASERKEEWKPPPPLYVPDEPEEPSDKDSKTPRSGA